MVCNFVPHEYQEQAIKFIQSRKAAGLLLDMGLGKTGATLETMRRDRHLLPALVVAPLRCVYKVWPVEIKKFDFPLTHSIVHGKNKLDSLLEFSDIKITNYETLPWLVRIMKERKRVPFNTIVIDESSKVKNPFSLRFKNCEAIAKHCEYKILLTGTPIPQGYMDLWSQVYLMDQGASLGSYQSYVDTHFERVRVSKFREDFVLKPRHNEAIEESVRHLMLRGDACELLNMPELVTNTIKLELNDSDMTRYKEVEFGYLQGTDSLKHHTESPFSPIRCCASGFLYQKETVDDSLLTHVERIHNNKLDAVQEILDGIGNKSLLVAFNFRGEREMLVDRFGCEFIDGTTTNKKADELVEQWNRGGMSMLAIHPATVGFGLNMQQGGRHLCWYSLPVSGEMYRQTLARIYRQGQSGAVTVHKLITEGTVEEAIDTLLRRKILTEQNLLIAMRRIAKKRYPLLL